MILDSFDNAEADFAKRLLIEARLEAETILAAVERAPQHPAWQKLTDDEKLTIDALKSVLQIVLPGEDANAIRSATVSLDQATRRFAELMMEEAVTSAIRGKTMDAAGEELGDEIQAPHPMATAEFK
jgi:molecular chaperone DnaK (HSP70)